MEKVALSYITGVAHIGIAVPDIEEARGIYELLGFSAVSNEVFAESGYGVRVMIMRFGTQEIELLEPLEKGKESPIDTYISSKPYKMYHLAYKVSNLEGQIEILEKKKFVMINDPKETGSSEGKRAVFMFHRSMGIIELVEE